VRPHVVYQANERQLIEEVRRAELNAIEEVLYPVEVGRARSAHHADDPIALFEEQLGKIGTVLPGDSGDDCAF